MRTECLTTKHNCIFTGRYRDERDIGDEWGQTRTTDTDLVHPENVAQNRVSHSQRTIARNAASSTGSGAAKSSRSPERG